MNPPVLGNDAVADVPRGASPAEREERRARIRERIRSAIRENHRMVPEWARTQFQKDRGYEGFRFNVEPFIGEEGEAGQDEGFTIVDFETSKSFVVTPRRLEALKGVVDYFEVSPEEDVYLFGLHGVDYVIPISNRMEPFRVRPEPMRSVREREARPIHEVMESQERATIRLHELRQAQAQAEGPRRRQ